jgi:hypothetical protein
MALSPVNLNIGQFSSNLLEHVLADRHRVHEVWIESSI